MNESTKGSKVRSVLALLGAICAFALVLTACGGSQENATPAQHFAGTVDGDKIVPEATGGDVILAGSQKELPQFRVDMRQIGTTGNFVNGLAGNTPQEQAESYIKLLGTHPGALANAVWDTKFKPVGMNDVNDFGKLVVDIKDSSGKVVGQQLSEEGIRIHAQVAVDIRKTVRAGTADPNATNTGFTSEGVVTGGTVVQAGYDMRVIVYEIGGYTQQVLVRCGNRVYYKTVSIPPSKIIVVIITKTEVVRPEPGEIIVCELSSKTAIKIREDQYDGGKHSRDFRDCKPEEPSTTPSTTPPTSEPPTSEPPTSEPPTSEPPTSTTTPGKQPCKDPSKQDCNGETSTPNAPSVDPTITAPSTTDAPSVPSKTKPYTPPPPPPATTQETVPAPVETSQNPAPVTTTTPKPTRTQQPTPTTSLVPRTTPRTTVPPNEGAGTSAPVTGGAPADCPVCG